MMEKDEQNAFDKWFGYRDWGKENSRREDFEEVWLLLLPLSFQMREKVMDIMVNAMSDECN